jgi:hypothetical protein
MTTQEQFLWVVQTMFLTNAVNVASNPPIDRSVISVTGSIVAAGEALRASALIPQDMSAGRGRARLLLPNAAELA